MRHRWSRPFRGLGVDECVRCGTTRDVIASVGVKYHRALRTYMQPDGVRHTGMAPVCDPSLKALSRPILDAYEIWRNYRGSYLFAEANWYQVFIEI